MRVSDLFISPLKSARGIALPAADIEGYGLPGDRRAIITDAPGHFITPRELQDLARIEVRPEASAF
ncbi:MOSC N-terminal beta barrel domain-containing protein, partial [Rhizobium ruizarguesonis]